MAHDEALTQRVKAALLAETRSAGIDVKVEASDDGWVRLYGVVDALSHKDQAELIARRVDGVRTVENDLTVGVEGQRDRGNITDELAARLAESDVAFEIGAEFHPQGGTAHLYGKASKAVEQEAIRIARGTPGVAEVVSHIEVSTAGKVGSGLLSRQVLSVLQRQGYDQNQIQVWSDGGVVHLRGILPSEEKKRAVLTAVRHLEGVERIEHTLVTESDLLH